MFVSLATIPSSTHPPIHPLACVNQLPSGGASRKEPACQCRRQKRTQVQSLSQEDPLEEEMATNSSVLAWRIPWTEEPGGLESIELQRVQNDWSDLALKHLKTRAAWIRLIQSNRLFTLCHKFVWELLTNWSPTHWKKIEDPPGAWGNTGLEQHFCRTFTSSYNMLSCSAGWLRIALSAPLYHLALWGKEENWVLCYISSPGSFARLSIMGVCCAGWWGWIRSEHQERVFMRPTRPLATAGHGDRSRREHRSSGSQPQHALGC